MKNMTSINGDRLRNLRCTFT